MGKLGHGSQSLIRHDYKRACYLALLAELPIEDIKEYFGLAPLIVDGKEVKGQDLYRLLWRYKAKITIAWDVALDNQLEAFLLSKGKRVQDILDKILIYNNKSTVIPGRVLLTWIYPKLESLFNSVDSRDMVFALFSLYTETWITGLVHRRIKRQEENGWVKSTMVFFTDPTFEEYIDWDLGLVGRPQAINAPVMMGLPPFEEFRVICDTRPPGRVIWLPEDTPAFDGEHMLIRDEVFGKRTTFADFCKRQEIELSKFNPPDMDVIEMHYDYHCPKRGRVVLNAGCIYGAPLFLYQVKHRKLSLQGKGVLGNLISDLSLEDESSSIELETKHHELVASLAGKAVFEYHVVDESITLNGEHFTKGVAAKIMKNLLESYVNLGKREFEYRELKRLFEISLGQKNSNFEVRFYRLVDKLKEDCLALRIEKTGRGKFQLVVEGELEYKEACQ